MSDYQISFYYQQENHEIGQSIVIRVICQCKKNQYIDMKNWYVESSSSKYWVSCREYLSGSNVVKMRLQVLSSATIDTLPGTLTITLFDSHGKNVKAENFALQMENFTLGLFNEGTTKRNILLFGLAGSSKSTFINSCYSLVSSVPRQQIAKSGGHDVRVTSELQGYRLANLDTKQASRIFLWDVWGLEQDNYQGAEFEAVLQGKLERGWKMAKPVAMDDLLKPINEDHKQHCVIFFVPVGELVNKQSAMMKKTKDFCHMAIKLDVPFVVALTKVDTVVPAFRDNPDPNLQEVAQLVQQATKYFNVAENQVFPLINYWKETEKRFKLDRVIYRILFQAFKVAGDLSLSDYQPKMRSFSSRVSFRSPATLIA